MIRVFFVTCLLMLALFGLPPHGFSIQRDVTPTPTPTPQPVSEELIRDYILSRQILSGEDKDKADANRDSLVDAADLVWLIAGFTPTPTPVEIIVMLPDEVPLTLVRIPAGSFQMGSPENERSRLVTESPLHSVNIAYDFYMGKTEITQIQWMALMGSWPGTPPTANNGLGDNYPAYYISWHDAHDFITALNDHITSTVQTPLSVYLPSEAEWEYACRAGTQTRFFFGDSLDCADEHQDCAAGVLPGNRSDYMWYVGNNDPSGVKPAGTKRPNQFGLHDMSGSVFEWCEDDWHDSYIGAPDNGNAWMDSPRSDMRCFRGASVTNDAKRCRSAHRYGKDPGRPTNVMGFRIAAPVPESTPTPTPTPDFDGLTILLPGNVPISFVLIPAGSFDMGSSDTERGRTFNEGPVHTVKIEYDLYIGRTEVTQAQWLALMKTWPGNPPADANGLGDHYPAYFLSWDNANNFISALNDHISNTSQGPFNVRLPSEAEWEYACRAGTQTRFFFGDSLDCDDLSQNCAAGILPGNRSEYMWFSGNNSPAGSKPVASGLRNQFGLYDMSGNVWEWCEDDWHNTYTGAPLDGKPWVNSPRTSSRVMRGGDWNDEALYCRSAQRYYLDPSTGSKSIGFRLAGTP